MTRPRSRPAARRMLLAAALAFAAAAHAQPASQQAQKCVNAKGETYYTNKPAQGDKCTPVGAAISVVPAGRTAPPTNPQAAERETQRMNQQRELESAERQLADARKALAEQEAIRTGDERNYQRVLDRLKPYQDRVAEAEKNVERLRAQQR